MVGSPTLSDHRALYVSVGTPSTERAESEHTRLLAALASTGVDVAGRVEIRCEDDVRLVVSKAAETNPDVLALIVLCGRTAPLQVAVVQSINGVPTVVWAVGKEYAFPSSALAVGALKEEGRRVTLLHGAADDADTMAGFLAAVRAGTAVTHLGRAKIGVIGGLFPNLVSCRYEPAFIRERLGAELLSVSYEHLRQEMHEAAGDRAALDCLLERCAKYDVRVPQEALLPGLSLHVALKSIAGELGLEAFAVECWSGLPEAVGLNPCLGFIEDSYVLACEGDVMLALLLLMVRHITGTSACAADVLYLDTDGVLTLCHCGGPCMAGSDVVLDFSAAAQAAGFTTVTCRPNLPPGPVTLVRFYGGRCDRMHVATGDLLGCDRSNDLTVEVRLHGGRSEFIDACLGNHYAIVPGDIREELAILCKWLEIAAVYT